MKSLIASALLFLTAVSPALAADIFNGDAVERTVAIVEAGRASERTLDPGEHADLCPNGCMISFPDGSQMALSGMEAVVIRDGAARLD